MIRRALGACLGALLFCGATAQAQAAGPAIVLTWVFNQDMVNPATGFAISRCIQMSSGCTMTDLSGATAIPLVTLTYTDSQIVQNVTYCYAVSALNSFGRGKPSTTTCGVIGGPPTTIPQNLTLKLNPATTP